MQNNIKIQTGWISTFIIFLLNIFSIIYQILDLDFTVMNSFISFIDDASVFMTLICISFGVIIFIYDRKSYRLLGFCLLDIIVINRLYSDAHLMEILKIFIKLDKRVIVLFAVVTIFIVYFIYNLIIRKKVKLKDIDKEELITNDIEKENTKRRNKFFNDRIEEHVSNKQTNKSDNQQYNSNPRNIYKREMKNLPRFLYMPLVIVCLIFIFLSISDYLFFTKKLFLLGIKRPILLEQNIGYLYYGAIISISILVVFILVNKFKHKSEDSDKDENTFRISAIISLLIEIILSFLIWNDNIKPQLITENFLSTIADNTFSFILTLIIFFLILQMIVTILMHLFLKSTGDELIETIEKDSIKIEIKMVKLAYGIIKGCIDLFDFIPDFFSTIGILLLDKEEVIENKEKNPKDKRDKEKNEVIK